MHHLFYTTGIIVWGLIGLSLVALFLLGVCYSILEFWNWNRKHMTCLYQLWEAQRVYYLYIIKNEKGQYDRQLLLDICDGIKLENPRMTWVRNLYARVIRDIRAANSYKEYNNPKSKDKNIRR